MCTEGVSLSHETLNFDIVLRFLMISDQLVTFFSPNQNFSCIESILSKVAFFFFLIFISKKLPSFLQ